MSAYGWVDWLGLAVVIGGGYILLLVWALS